ncbi:Transposon Tf2-9 polyprotein [Orchesella cincta]|uniref:Transposon Tf2-9 polyprotein n=1 Tax=Orchesella cincta TaxID=48709 RepID=A0A1D2M3E9_ORCCI|nr:Transposon Tf2-9 polyprotein [Orchesella cincta]
MEADIIRATGRLERADIPEHRKHPIILPHDHAITRMLISHHHQSLHHAGFQLLMSTLQRDFCILRARDTIRHMIQRCVVCRSKKAETAKQLMGQLPTQRVNTSRPFESSGVDFAGPFYIRLMKGRCNKTFKAYMCIFVCMSTRAVHLEPVSELSTEAFIATLKRFIGRRGMCLHLFSDCGTNFAVADHLACRGINWTFNPHLPLITVDFGSWCQVSKIPFKTYNGNARVTYEEFHTILCQVEACMNSRPICPASSVLSDLNPLTPGHFLIGDALTAIPEADLTHLKENRLSRWQRTQQMIQHFWRRWSSEYLTTLLQRNKWTRSMRTSVW